MNEKKIKIFARNVFLIAKKKNCTNILYHEFKIFKSLLEQNQKLNDFLDLKGILKTKSWSFLYSIFKKNFSELFISILGYIIKNRLFSFIHSFFNCYKDYLRKSSDNLFFKIVSSRILEKSEKDQLKQSILNIKKNENLNIHYEYKINKNLIHGIIIINKSNYTLLDQSLLYQLSLLENNLYKLIC